MTTLEAPARPIFGQITLEDMRANKALTQTVLPLIRDVCKLSRGRYTLDSVTEALLRNEMELFGVMRPPATLSAIALTKVTGEAYEIALLGPDADEVFMFLGQFKGLARSRGCSRVLFNGSRIWRREGRVPNDFKPVGVIYEADLGDVAAAR